MNHSLVGRLIWKDWYFNRWAIAGFVAAGIAALLPLVRGGDLGFYVGTVLLITVLIAIGIHLTMITVVHERQNQTLAFVMSLPITAGQYTRAKVLANLLLFGGAWLVLAVGTVTAIAASPRLPDGLIPFAVAILLQLFAGYLLTLGVAIVSESLGWTVAAIVIGNLLVQGVMYWLSHHPAVAPDLPTDTIAWRTPTLGLLAAELVAMVVILALTFLLQARKTDFL